MPLDRNNKLLLLGFLALLLASYQFGLRRTFEAHREHGDLSAKWLERSRLPGQLALLRQRELDMDQRLAGLDLGGGSQQAELLKFLDGQAAEEGAKVIGFGAPHTATDGKQVARTLSFEIEGGYTATVKILNAIENHGAFGSVVHVDMEKVRDRRTKREHLRTTVFLQQMG